MGKKDKRSKKEKKERKKAEEDPATVNEEGETVLARLPPPRPLLPAPRQ